MNHDDGIRMRAVLGYLVFGISLPGHELAFGRVDIFAAGEQITLARYFQSARLGSRDWSQQAQGKCGPGNKSQSIHVIPPRAPPSASRPQG
jgi:hypothetical protein